MGSAFSFQPVMPLYCSNPEECLGVEATCHSGYYRKWVRGVAKPFVRKLITYLKIVGRYMYPPAHSPDPG